MFRLQLAVVGSSPFPTEVLGKTYLPVIRGFSSVPVTVLVVRGANGTLCALWHS